MPSSRTSPVSSLQVLSVDSLPVGEKYYEPKGAIREMFHSRAPEILLEGPAGTGKSRGILEKLNAVMMKHPHARAAIVRKTRESLTQSAMVTFEKEVMDPPGCIPFNHESQEYRYPNGSVVVVGGMDKPSRILSTQYDFVYPQEATELEQEDLETLSTRLRNGRVPYQQIVMDCNPGAPEHWLNQRAIAGGCVRLRSRHQDNPSITPEYLERLRQLTGYIYRRLYLGEWVAAEGMYFTEWDESVHVCEPFAVPASWTRWCSIDYGYADPFCCLWLARDPAERHRVYVYREAYQRGLRDEEQAKAVASASLGERISWYIPDPSTFNKRSEQDKPSIASVYAKNGLRPLAPGVNERISGWQTVRRALAHSEGHPPRLQVMRGRAPNLVRTLPAMVHDPLDSEDLADKIKSAKTEDHAVDCLRYGLMLEAMPSAQAAKLRDFKVSA